MESLYVHEHCQNSTSGVAERQEWSETVGGRRKKERHVGAVWWRGSGGEAERAEGGVRRRRGEGSRGGGVPGGGLGEGVLGHQE